MGVFGFTLSGCVFSGNTAYNYYGSVLVHDHAAAPIVVTDSVVENNYAGQNGAIYGPNIVLTRCRFSHNSGSFGDVLVCVCVTLR